MATTLSMAPKEAPYFPVETALQLSPKNDALSFLPINSACPDGLCDVPVEVGLFFDGTYCFPEIFSKYSPSTRRNPCDAIIFGELTALQYEELPRFNPMRITHPPGVERVSYDRRTVPSIALTTCPVAFLILIRNVPQHAT